MNIADALFDAKRHGTALAAFNAATLEAVVAVGTASKAAGYSAIIQTSSKLVTRYGAPYLKSLFDAAMIRTGAHCFLHLDHCDDLAVITACAEAGWDMVMFDGSHLPIAENCAMTKRVTDIAHAHNTAVEAEVGAIGGEEDGREAVANYAKPEDIAALCAAAKPDCIAVGFGNVHGDYTNKNTLDWTIFENAHKITSLPLVLHGGSGLSNDEFRRAIRAGAAKINISTAFKKVYASTITNSLAPTDILRDPSVIHDELVKQLSETAFNYITLFAGKKEASCSS